MFRVAQALRLGLVVASVLLPKPSQAFTGEEHRLAADSALAGVTRECAKSIPPNSPQQLSHLITLLESLPKDTSQTFGELTASLARVDFGEHRFHIFRETPLEQALRLKSEDIERVWRVLNEGRELPSASVFASEITVCREKGVVANYLLYHLMALRIASLPLDNQISITNVAEAALSWEAYAQGYLHDALSAGHMVMPWRGNLLAPLQTTNYKAWSQVVSAEGVFVLNSRGEVWQAFGEHLLHWYSPHYEHVLACSQVSIRELVLTLFVAHELPIPGALTDWMRREGILETPRARVARWIEPTDGETLFNTSTPPAVLPSLMYIPMPISATWSHAPILEDSLRKSERRFYPQLRERGLHDPSISEASSEFLYSRTGVPIWLIPPVVEENDVVRADSVVRFVSGWAAVEYYSPLSPVTSAIGVHLRGGVVLPLHHEAVASRVGAGYTFRYKIFQPTLDLSYMNQLSSKSRDLFILTAGHDIPIPVSYFIGKSDGLWIEVGGLNALHGEHRRMGGVLSVGLYWNLDALGGPGFSGTRLRLQYSNMQPEGYVVHAFGLSVSWY